MLSMILQEKHCCLRIMIYSFNSNEDTESFICLLYTYSKPHIFIQIQSDSKEEDRDDRLEDRFILLNVKALGLVSTLSQGGFLIWSILILSS